MTTAYNSGSLAHADGDDVYKKAYWRLLPLILCCYLVAYLDRVNVGFAKLQMLDALKFDDAIYGLGSGIFFIGYLIFEVPSNMILRRVGARVWIARIMITWGVVSAAMLLVQTPMQFYIARFLLGVAEAGFAPGIMYLLTLWFPAQRRGRAMAIYVMGAPLAFVVGGPLSGGILDVFQDVQPLQAWQWLFLVEAIPAVLLGVIVFFCLSDDFRKVSWLSAAEKQKIESDLQAENVDKVEHGSVREFLASRQLWVFVLIYFCLIMGLYAVGFWMPSLIKRAGVADPFHIGLYSAVPNIVAAIALYLSGRGADISGKRRLYFAGMLTIGAIGLALAMVINGGPAITVACLSLAAAGVYSCISLFWALPTSMFVGASVAAALAFVNSFGNIAGFVSPYLVGWLNVTTGRTDIGMYIIGAIMVFGALVTMLLPKRLDK
ncbi:MFS transporter [Herbaspirillum sp. LeCh32-8]|uniref:MFS transporter n=1 Tax=Herbaspirillum sp. LeCh32-8 TaxID=2821356 RepID=UPI001AE814E4|nr:MFS transporter [Herbaspirillum sp. LeCh32-8]MBP0600812.1 MFS transporter [Herbaspirillum sp. LeCh32-8]